MNPVRQGWRVLRRQGPRVALQKALTRAFTLDAARPGLVRYEDVLSVDWRTPHPSVAHPRLIGEGPLVVAWIMSPPGANSGGHQNIFRFIEFLEKAGHSVRIYLDSAIAADSPAEVRARMASSSSYPKLAASIESFPSSGIPVDVDAVFATGWETAYASYNDPSDARRFYFVQDFEPLFYPASSEALFAENTYRFGFTGITAGGWLATKLARDYGMTAASYDFGSDERNYRVTNSGPRDAVFFYARPETARRGFELGVMALDLVVRARPQTTIVMAGQDLRGMRIPFAHDNPGNVQVGELNELYNRCAAGLVLSLTNMSLLPLELLSAGVIPVVNDGENNSLVSSNPYISYTTPSPQALADALLAALEREDQAAYAAEAAASVSVGSWARSGEQFLAAFEAGVHG